MRTEVNQSDFVRIVLYPIEMLGERANKKKALNYVYCYETVKEKSVILAFRESLLLEQLSMKHSLLLPVLLIVQAAGRVFAKQILRLEIYKWDKSLHEQRKPSSST